MSDINEPIRTISIFNRLRNYFFTGLVVASPIGITLYIGWWFITFVDEKVKPIIPLAYNPETYLESISWSYISNCISNCSWRTHSKPFWPGTYSIQ